MACGDVTPNTIFLPTCGLTTMQLVKSSTPPNGSLILPGDPLEWQLLVMSNADWPVGITVEDIFVDCDYVSNVAVALPWILTVDGGNPCRYILSNPTAVNPGVYPITITATAGADLGGGVYEGFGTLENTANILTPDPTPGNTIELVFRPLLTGALPDQLLGAVVNYQYQIRGGLAPFVVSLYSGALPDGLAISAAGLLTGTTTALGDFDFILLLTDANANEYYLSDDCTVT